MKLVDEQQRIRERDTHYAAVVDIAGETFGRGRMIAQTISALEVGTIHIDRKAGGHPPTSGVEIIVGPVPRSLSINVYDKTHLDDAKTFAKKYESLFEGEVTLHHNFG